LHVADHLQIHGCELWETLGEVTALGLRKSALCCASGLVALRKEQIKPVRSWCQRWCHLDFRSDGPRRERVSRGAGARGARGQSPLGWTRVLARSVLSRPARSASSSCYIVWHRVLALHATRFWGSVHQNAWFFTRTETHTHVLKYTGTQAHRQTDTQTQTRRHTSIYRHRYRLSKGLVHCANGFGERLTADVAGCWDRQRATMDWLVWISAFCSV
jgi:hypothetical protein